MKRSRWLDLLRHPGHVTDKQILALVDGETAGRSRRAWQRHLESCWTCRARLREVESTIAEFVAVRSSLVVPAPPRGWVEFPRRLHAASAEIRRVRQPRRYWRWGAIAACILILSVWLARPPGAVSARELLDRSISTENVEGSRLERAAVHQQVRLRISRGGTSVGNTVLDVSGNLGERGMARIVTESGDLWHELDTVLDTNGLGDYPLLSAAAFGKWRSSVVVESEDVRVNGGSESGLYIIRCRSNGKANGRITEGELALRSSDFRVVRLRWLVPVADGERIYELAEISRVLAPRNIPPVSAAVASPAAPHHDPSRLRLPGVSQSVSPVSVAPDLDELEMEAQSSIHRLHLCLGGEVDVVRDANGGLVVRGIATAEERATLASILPASPLLHVEVHSPEEAQPARKSSHHVLAQMPDDRTNRIELPLVEYLRARDIDPSPDLSGVSGNIMDLAWSAQRHASSVRRLAEKYGSTDVLRMNRTARSRLESMLADHLTELSAATLKIRGTLAKLLGQDLPHAPLVAVDPRVVLEPGWASACLESANKVDVMNEGLHELFTVSPETRKQAADSVADVVTRVAEAESSIRKTSMLAAAGR